MYRTRATILNSLAGLIAANVFVAASAAQARADCPGKVICPLTGQPVCKDLCPLGPARSTKRTVTDDVAFGMLKPLDAEEPISLATSLDPLIDHFNSGQGGYRFVTLVSSTCPACVFGAKAVRQSVLEAYPDADVQVSVVWIDMLSSDNKGAAKKSSAIFDDARVKQFHDPNRKAGRALAKQLLYKGSGPAWDIYLYYDKDAVWGENPPKPEEWFHQLGGGKRADAKKFRPGEQLVEALREATGRIVAQRRTAAAKPAEGATVRFDGVVLQVDGMTCQGCADAVTKALSSMPGVKEARVDFDSKLAWIKLNSSNTPSRSDLIKAVEKCGFKAAVPDQDTVLDIPVEVIGDSAKLNLQVLSFPGCPNADVLCANLERAIETLGVSCEIQNVNLKTLSRDDPLRRWGSPTVLVDGKDLMGVARAPYGGLCCRIYSGGKIPDAEAISERLRDCCVELSRNAGN